MKKYLLSVFVVFMVFGCKQKTLVQEVKKELPKIAIAGIGIESSTFSPAQSEEAAFHARIGDSIFTRYPFFAEDSDIRKRADWVPTLLGKSLPGGIVTRESYESMVD